MMLEEAQATCELDATPIWSTIAGLGREISSSWSTIPIIDWVCLGTQVPLSGRGATSLT
jgi:hypothetical protein